jgi:hypothetical protein
MTIHLTTRTVGIMFRVRVCIELRKKLTQRSGSCCQRKGLISVISSIKIAMLEKLCHGHLGHFFTISKNPKLGLPSKDFFSAEQAGLAALKCNGIIADDSLPERLKGEFISQLLLSDSCVLHATKLTNFVNKKSKPGLWGQTTNIWAKPRELGNKKAAGQ